MSTAASEPQMRERLPVTDLVLGGVLLLVGVGLLLASAQLQAGSATDPLGPRGFPSLLGVGFVGSGIALLAKAALVARHPAAYVADADAEHGDEEDHGPAMRSRLLLASLTIVAYVLVLPVGGFLLSTPAFITATIALQGGAARRSFIAMVVGFPIAVYLLFAVLLGVPLPTGVFDPLLLAGGR